MTLKILTMIGFVIILPLLTRAVDQPVDIVGYNGVSVSRSIASFLHVFHDFKMIFDSMIVMDLDEQPTCKQQLLRKAKLIIIYSLV